MTTSNKSTLGSISTLSSKSRLKLTKQVSEPAVQSRTLHRNSITQVNFKRDRCLSLGSLMPLTNSFQELSLKSKDMPTISQSSSCSDLSQEPSSTRVRPKLLKRRLRSLNKKELKNFSQSFPTYDREKYNADGSLHTMHCLPTLNVQWEQAKLARYLRTPRQNEDEKDDLLSKQLYPIFKYQSTEEAKHKTTM